LFRLSILQSMPMQASLFELTQQIAARIPSEQIDAPKITVAIFTSAIHHGNLMQHEFEGIDAQQRALLVTDGRAWSIGYEPHDSLPSLLSKVHKQERIRNGSAQVYSFVCDCSSQSFYASIAPRPKSDVIVRQPAVAGTFYPAEDDLRDAVVDTLLADLPDVCVKRPNSIMVPHAGLRFSGRVAARVWGSIEIPEHVLIIGPKHTSDGVDWAIAPVSQWMLSGQASMPGDPSFAKQLNQEVPEFQLDSEAHRREHGIEVQLPILHRLAPTTRVSAIAMHGGDVLELRNAANKLAKFLKTIPRPPMLVISSDMNHFADDAENRRRDRMALDAMQTLDPEQLLLTCESNSISMCGLRPAVLVMMTLQALGQPMTFTEVDYATSSEVTGDKTRVVGYAGVRL
jgi:AmmeMemoRadiSam system protein B